jgi:hypothetical protein
LKPGQCVSRFGIVAHRQSQRLSPNSFLNHPPRLPSCRSSQLLVISLLTAAPML